MPVVTRVIRGWRRNKTETNASFASRPPRWRECDEHEPVASRRCSHQPPRPFRSTRKSLNVSATCLLTFDWFSHYFCNIMLFWQCTQIKLRRWALDTPPPSGHEVLHATTRCAVPPGLATLHEARCHSPCACSCSSPLISSPPASGECLTAPLIRRGAWSRPDLKLALDGLHCRSSMQRLAGARLLQQNRQ